MNVAEGARRMQVVGRCLNLTGASFIVLNVFFMVSMQFHGGLHNVLGPIAPLLIFGLPFSVLLVIVGGLLWIASWIVSGFAAPPPFAEREDVSSAPTMR